MRASEPAILMAVPGSGGDAMGGEDKGLWWRFVLILREGPDRGVGVIGETFSATAAEGDDEEVVVGATAAAGVGPCAGW